MTQKTKKGVLVLLPLLAVICVGLWFLRGHYLRTVLNYQEVTSHNGVWDLTEFDFETGFVRLCGEGETIQRALVAPAEFDDYADEIQYGKYNEFPANTTRLRMYLPDNGRYMVVAYSVDYGERTFINGEWRTDAGIVSETAETAVHGLGYITEEVQVQNGELEVVRQTINFVHRANGNPVSLYVGKPEIMRRFVALETGQSGVIMGVFLALFLAHGMLYFILRRYRANLYFAFLCLGWCLRCGITERKLFTDWFPDIPWEVLFRGEYILVAVAGSCIFLVINEMFPAALPKVFLRIMLGYSAFYAALCLFLPTYPLSYMSLICPAVYMTSTIPLAAYVYRYLSKRMKTKEVRIEHWAIVLSFLLLSFAATHDVFYYNGLTTVGVLNDLGFMTFALTQMFAIFCGTMREIEQVMKAEQALRTETEALQRVSTLKEEFLHDLSHELQMPITVVSGFAQLTAQMMEDEPVEREEIRANMLRVVDEAEHMEQMVTSLLDAAAIENSDLRIQREKVDIGQLVQTLATIQFPLMDRNSNASVVQIEEGLLICGDRERLRQVLLNLISNAVKHTKNGTVAFTAEPVEGGLVRVEVRDTGAGISEELLPNLFHRFAKPASAKGNGLGLYICMKLIEAHGGTIGIESETGEGTCVWFTVPVWKEEDDGFS